MKKWDKIQKEIGPDQISKTDNKETTHTEMRCAIVQTHLRYFIKN